MTAALLVPLRAGALWAPEGLTAQDGELDASLLPYVGPNGDVNPAHAPYLADDFLRQPFAEDTLHLRPGLHLFWSMPSALTVGLHRPGATGAAVDAFPALPNRWLVIRRNPAPTRWWIESDYLFPDAEAAAGEASGAPAYPVHGDRRQERPYRYLGRSWNETDPRPSPGTPTDYLDRLVAPGWGTPLWSAAYAGCRTSFGIVDPDHAQHVDVAVTYEIFGWHADPAHDPLPGVLSAATQDPWLAVADELDWVVDAGTTAPPGTRTVTCARLHVPAGAADGSTAHESLRPGLVAVGSTGSEALAALLAHHQGPGATRSTETHLEALAVQPDLEHRALDLDLALEDLRHTAGFRPVPSGHLWEIVRSDDDQGDQVPLPPALATALHRLNQAQGAYDHATADVARLREQVYLDWASYLRSAYPPVGEPTRLPHPDHLRRLVETHDLDVLHAALDRAGHLQVIPHRHGSTRVSARGGLAEQVAGSVREVRSLLEGGATPLLLQARPAPRYWQPLNPVVLVEGPAATLSALHEPDTALPCLPVTVTSFPPTDLELIGALDTLVTSHGVGTSTSDGAAWHPLTLEWEAEVRPTAVAGFDPHRPGPYPEDYVLRGYDLPRDSADLRLRGPNPPRGAPRLLSGRTLLTTAGATVLAVRLGAYLARRYLADRGGAPEPGSDPASYFDAHQDDVLAWFAALASPSEADAVVLESWHRLQATPVQAQSLAGFNDALLQRRRGYQLPVDDPLGFPEYRAFTVRVAAALGDAPRLTPVPDDPFTPIRAGQLALVRLRLVDVFGRSVDLVSGDSAPVLVAAETMQAPGGPSDQVWLPPRLSQPARLRARFLSAARDDLEANAHPETTPICGWLMNNALDRSIMLFDADGHALGAVGVDARWRPAPDRPGSIPQQITNPHLRQVAQHLLALSPADLAAVLDEIETSLEAIAPDSFAQHRATALLIGRPIALIRVELGLELHGRPVTDVGPRSLAGDLALRDEPGSGPAPSLGWDDRAAHRRDTRGVEGVRFPVRLGEHARLSDGVVGFWPEDGAGRHQGSLQVPRGPAPASPIELTVSGRPRRVAVLMDPRAQLHCTTGILPTKVLTLPPEHIAEALRRIDATFLVAPVLSDADRLELGMPTEPGFAWSWLDVTPTGPVELNAHPVVRRDDVLSAMGDLPRVWEAMVDAGWVRTLADGSGLAEVLPTSGRTRLAGQPAHADERADTALARLSRSLAAPDPSARFGRSLRLREGYLRLRPASTRTPAAHDET